MLLSSTSSMMETGRPQSNCKSRGIALVVVLNFSHRLLPTSCVEQRTPLMPNSRNNTVTAKQHNQHRMQFRGIEDRG